MYDVPPNANQHLSKCYLVLSPCCYFEHFYRGAFEDWDTFRSLSQPKQIS